MNNKSEGKGCFYLFFSLHIIVGLGTFLISIYNIGKVIQAKTWIPIEATIVHPVKIKSDFDSGTAKLKVYYFYVVNGQQFGNDSFAFGNYGNVSPKIEKFSNSLELLKRSKKIQIWFNPKKPDESVVVRGMNNSILFILIFSILWNSLLAPFLTLPLFKNNNNDLFSLYSSKKLN